jgi:hypothetical protein
MRRIAQIVSSTALAACLSLAVAPVATAAPSSSQDIRIVARTDTSPHHRHYHVVRHVRRVRHVHNGHVWYSRQVYYTRVYNR